VVYWDEDGLKDLLVGRSDGMLKLYTNVGTDEDPHFDAGTLLEYGEPGSKISIDVGSRAVPIAVDWNSDGAKDLVVGAISGAINVFLNEGTDTTPDFRVWTYAQDDGANLSVPSGRSSPCVLDLDHDGRKDLLTGNTNGQVLFYPNVGADADPVFSGYAAVYADTVPIDLPGTPRSRPSVCDWTGDGFDDLLVGAGDGLVHLYQGIEHNHWADVAEDKTELDATVALLAARPNPFSPRTIVPLVVSEGQRVNVSVYDPGGRRVALLADRHFEPGRHELPWRGTDDAGRRLPSGVYLVRVQALNEVAVSKVLILR
jgi:hypothetical protein